MGTNRPRSLVRRHAGTGLEAGSGGTLDVDLSELDPKTAPVMADSVAGIDSEADDASVLMTLTNCLKVMGETLVGDKATSSLSEVDGVAKVNIGETTASIEPTTASKILVEIGGVNKAVTLANAAKPIAETMCGDNLTTGLSEVDGAARVNINGTTAKTPLVVADAILVNDSQAGNINKSATLTTLAALMGAMAQMPADLKSSLFVTYAEFDAGTDQAVDTKLTDALEAKGQLIAVFGIVTELWNGTADSTVQLSSDAVGATAIAADIVMDNGSSQVVGSVVGSWPVAGANSIVASGGDVYAYTAGDATRGTGKIGFVLLWMKTA